MRTQSFYAHERAEATRADLRHQFIPLGGIQLTEVEILRKRVHELEQEVQYLHAKLGD